MEFYENGGGATAKLSWSSASQPKVIIPQSQLYPTTAANGQVSFQWLVTDQLGTPRMVIDKAGSLSKVKRHDYLPFGEELYVGVGGRTWQQGYTGDNVRQQFTGYERDQETGLDFAQARYFSSAQGRFTAIDPLLASGSPGGPQSWNRYSYALNNPLRYTDPTGMVSDGLDEIPNQPDPPPQQQPPSQPASSQSNTSPPQTPAPVASQTASVDISQMPSCTLFNLPATVTVNQINTPDSVQVHRIEGVDALRIGVDLTFVFTDPFGQPVSGTASENVVALDGDPVLQDPAKKPLVGGTVRDNVATPPQPIPKTDAEQKTVLDNFNKPFVTKQLITVTVTATDGRGAVVTQVRNLNNKTQGVPRIAGGRIRGHTFTMEEP